MYPSPAEDRNRFVKNALRRYMDRGKKARYPCIQEQAFYGKLCFKESFNLRSYCYKKKFEKDAGIWHEKEHCI